VDKDRNSGIATALAFTPDSKRVLIGAYPTHQMEIASAKEIKLTEQYSSSILDPDVIELSPDGNFIVFGGLGTGIQFFDRSAGQFSEAFKQKSLFKQIYFYQFMPLGESSVVAGCPPFGVPMVAINDNLTGMITDSIAFATEFPAVAIALNGSTLAVTDAKIKKSETYLEWQKEFEEADDYLPTLISLWRIKGGKLDYLGQINTGNEEIVTAIGLSPDGKTLVTSGANLRFWDIGAIRNGNRVGSK
jgi:WD40 repeat protein